MVEPFKNFFNEAGVRGLAKHLARHDGHFDKEGFIDFVLDGFEALELKQRSTRITQGLQKFLGDDFPAANELLLKILHPGENDETDAASESRYDEGISGWMVMPVAQYVAEQGMDHFDPALSSLKEMTKRFSSEFAIRYFISAFPERSLAVLSDWAHDENYHVRRLVSEGSRPRLPWGIRLKDLVKDPSPILPLLEQLKDDPEEYVRRSVANNLNDISKDHPDLVSEIAAKWLKDASRERARLVQHACRSLIKSGHPGCLLALGYKKPSVSMKGPKILTPEVLLGRSLEFETTISSQSCEDQPLIVDFVVYHMKSNGTLAPKVFKWKKLTLKAGETASFKRRHPMKKITTRTYYPGKHRLEVQINGEVLGGADFTLQI